MESKQTITDRILEDAANEAAENERKAAEQSGMTVSAARAKADALLTDEKKKIASECDNILVKKRTLASLEKRKAELNCRQDIISGVYEAVENKLVNMPKTDYLAFIEKLINENAEVGDTVVISKKCELTENDIQKIEAVKRLNLNVSKMGEFSGGIILLGKKYDKKLTFSAIVADLREKTESETAVKLFGKE